jgi:cyanate permease
LRWRMLALAAMAYGCFGLGVGSIPPLADPIIRDLEMTSGQMGLVLGAWQLVFIGVGSPLGSLVDRWGARRAIVLGLCLILLSLLLRGMATNFITLLVSVAIFGAGAPIISVGMPKLVGQWFSGNDRGPATGSYVVGRDIGSVFALATAASFVIALTGSWRGISIVYGAITLVVIALWMMLGKDAPLAPVDEPLKLVPPASNGTPNAPPNDGILSLLKIRNVQLVMLLGFVVFFMNHALGAWLPTVLQENGVSLAASGRWVAVGTGVAMISNFMVPSLARMGRRSVWLLAMLMGGALTTIGLISFTGSALIAMVLVGTIVRLPAMQVLTLVLLETPGVGARRMGAVGGMFFAIAEIGGFTGPLMMGLVRDSTDSLASGLWVVAGVAAVAVVLPVLIRERRA